MIHPLALTHAQTLFGIALALVAGIITLFALYVLSTTIWADRWTRKK